MSLRLFAWYEVRQAADAETRLSVLMTGKIDALLTDIVLLDGRALNPPKRPSNAVRASGSFLCQVWRI